MIEDDIKAYGGPGFIQKDEALKIMMECEHRSITEEKVGWPYKEGHKWKDVTIQIFYDGQWRDVCRTDLKDNVATTGSSDSFSEYLNAVHYGARILRNGHFAVIDSYSDG